MAIPQAFDDDIFETSDRVPQRDPLSTLVFATAMSLLMMDIIRSKAPNVSMVAYVDDTLLLRDVTQAITEVQTEATTGGLKLQKANTQVWSPQQESIDNEPLLRALHGRMGDKRGILILGKTVSEEPEDAIPIGNEAFVTDHISAIKQKLLDDLGKLEHLPHKLVKGEAGLQTAWGLLRRTVPSRFLHVLRGHAVAVELQDIYEDDLSQYTLYDIKAAIASELHSHPWRSGHRVLVSRTATSRHQDSLGHWTRPSLHLLMTLTRRLVR